MVIIRLILTILIFIIPILSYLTEGIMSWMGYDGKHCGEIEMANKIVREIIHAKGIDIGIYTKDLSFRTGCETGIQLSFGGLGRTSQSGF